MVSAVGGVGRIIATQVMQSLDVQIRLPNSKDSDADHSVLEALGARRYAPGRFLEQEPYVDVYDEEFRLKCSARRGAKFQK